MPGLRVGTTAPDFTLRATPDQSLKLSDFRGRPVILSFYPADWSPVCSDQLALYNELLGEFSDYDAVLMGISVDGPWCHVAFARDRGYRFPLLSDFEPKGEVARAYGVYRTGEGVAERALYVIDEHGTVRYAHVSPIGVNPGADGLLRTLENMRTERQEHVSLGGELQGTDMIGENVPRLAAPVSHEDHVRGRIDAPVQLVEYGDFQCHYCGRAYWVIESLLARLGDSVSFVFRHFPLTQVHPYAELAAEASEAADAQGRFWPMHHRLYENAPRLGPALPLELAGEIGLDLRRFQSDLASRRFRDKVRRQFMGGVRSGVAGTPAFFINDEMHTGSWDEQTLLQAILMRITGHEAWP